MTEKLFGMTGMRVEKDYKGLTRISLELVASKHYNPYHLESEKWSDLFPGNVIVKCVHCGQWSASKTSCKHCGAPVE